MRQRGGAPTAYSAVSVLAKAGEWQLALGLLSCMAHQLSQSRGTNLVPRFSKLQQRRWAGDPEAVGNFGTSLQYAATAQVEREFLPEAVNTFGTSLQYAATRR